MFVTLIAILSCFAILIVGVVVFSSIMDKLEKTKHAANKLKVPIKDKKKSKNNPEVFEAPYKAFEYAVKNFVKTSKRSIHGSTQGIGGIFQGTHGITGKKGVTGIKGIAGYFGNTGIEGYSGSIMGYTGSPDDVRGCTGTDTIPGETGIEDDYKHTGPVRGIGWGDRMYATTPPPPPPRPKPRAYYS
jgi:hypothetical protein